MNELLQRARELGLYSPGDDPRSALDRLLTWHRNHQPDEHDPDFAGHMAKMCAVQTALAFFPAPATA